MGLGNVMVCVSVADVVCMVWGGVNLLALQWVRKGYSNTNELTLFPPANIGLFAIE